MLIGHLLLRRHRHARGFAYAHTSASLTPASDSSWAPTLYMHPGDTLSLVVICLCFSHLKWLITEWHFWNSFGSQLCVFLPTGIKGWLQRWKLNTKVLFFFAMVRKKYMNNKTWNGDFFFFSQLWTLALTVTLMLDNWCCMMWGKNAAE